MRKGARELGRAWLVHPAMKHLLLSASILAAAAVPAASIAYAGAASPTLSPSSAPSAGSEPIRIVRVTTSTAKDSSCETATWPNIPASCLQREGVSAQSTASIEN
ncbi:hypothetical protein [Tianweitania sp.]|uniref:hypothetical protein n=1 Tax=Tianweitania sp. TaxID=2021634 RepID=UPI002898566E|nr:hypothetical protein [Tianweitania sp.]